MVAKPEYLNKKKNTQKMGDMKQGGRKWGPRTWVRFGTAKVQSSQSVIVLWLQHAV